MTAMMIDDGKRIAAGGARLQWHTIPIADIDLIASNTREEENERLSSEILRTAFNISFSLGRFAKMV